MKKSILIIICSLLFLPLCNLHVYAQKKEINEAIDKINRIQGKETVVLGSQQYTKKGGKGKAGHFADAIKRDLKSPCYTTRWSDIIKVK